MGNLIVQVKINGYGDAVMAGFTAGSKLMIFCTTCFCTCANGLTNFVSQNYGAHEFTRIKRGFYAELVISTLLVAAFFAAVFSFAEPLVKLFLSEEEDTAKTLEAGVQFVRIVSPFFFAVNVKVSADAAVRGSGGNAGFMVSTFYRFCCCASAFRVYIDSVDGICGRMLGVARRLDALDVCRARLLFPPPVPEKVLYRGKRQMILL